MSVVHASIRGATNRLPSGMAEVGSSTKAQGEVQPGMDLQIFGDRFYTLTDAVADDKEQKSATSQVHS